MIALDANVLVYVLDGHAVFGPRSVEVIREAVASKHSLVASEIALLELLSNQRLDDSKVQLVEETISDLGVVFIPVTKDILLEAARLRRHFKLGTVDSIHIASAKLLRADSFVTNDLELVKLEVEGLTIQPL